MRIILFLLFAVQMFAQDSKSIVVTYKPHASVNFLVSEDLYLVKAPVMKDCLKFLKERPALQARSLALDSVLTNTTGIRTAVNKMLDKQDKTISLLHSKNANLENQISILKKESKDDATRISNVELELSNQKSKTLQGWFVGTTVGAIIGIVVGVFVAS